MAVEQKTIEQLILKHIKLMPEIHIISLETSTQLIEAPEITGHPQFSGFTQGRRAMPAGTAQAIQHGEPQEDIGRNPYLYLT